MGAREKPDLFLRVVHLGSHTALRIHVLRKELAELGRQLVLRLSLITELHHCGYKVAGKLFLKKCLLPS